MTELYLDRVHCFIKHLVTIHKALVMFTFLKRVVWRIDGFPFCPLNYSEVAPKAFYFRWYDIFGDNKLSVIHPCVRFAIFNTVEFQTCILQYFHGSVYRSHSLMWVKIFADLKMSFTESNCGTGSEDGGNCSGLESSMEDLEVSSQASSGIVVGGRYALFLTDFLENIRSHTFLRV